MSESRYNDYGRRDFYSSSESRESSSESRKSFYDYSKENRPSYESRETSQSSESRQSFYNYSKENEPSYESRETIRKNKTESSKGIVDAIDTLIDMYRAGKIDGDDLANSLEKLNKS